MIEKNFDIPFIADLALREKQIQQNYRPIIAVHKWFARRPGTLFRGLLLSEFLEKPLHESFYQANSLKGIKVADPFMGGGTACGQLTETADRKKPGDCRHCGAKLLTAGPAKRSRCECPDCKTINIFPNKLLGAPRHRLFALEYHCPACKERHSGRFFKIPDSQDLAKADQAEERWAKTPASYVPDDEIPSGDETNRLHRWGYGHYREMFNARQLLGLELSAQRITRIANERVRNSLATNLSDLLRYQNMLCRYDTMALKSLDIFSVHGFPVGLVQCESNFMGIVDPKKRICIGSGGWANIIEKFRKAKAYCDSPFEIRHPGGKKEIVPINGEWIGDNPNGKHRAERRSVALHCKDAAQVELPPRSLDAVLTDPPYFGNVQYAELMDFCYVWLRRLIRTEPDAFADLSTRNPQELTGNEDMARGIDHFAQGLSSVFQKMAIALKPGSPLVFTYHHNNLAAYYPIAIAILDAGLTCSATLPCPAEMGAYEWLMAITKGALERKDVLRIKKQTYFGQELVPRPRRLALMNLFLHGLEPRISLGDSIYETDRGERYDCILTNPPFGTKGANQAPVRDDFTVSTSNKQLNFIQHVVTILKPGGRAAMVLPDNVLFSDQAGDVFKYLMEDCNVHTVLRLPNGTFTPYSQGVKANVIYFQKGLPTESIWIYDCRTNIADVTKKDRPLTAAMFTEFATCYGKDPNGQSKRKDLGEEGRFRKFALSQIKERNYNLDITWLKDENLEDPNSLPEPQTLASDAITELNACVDELQLILDLIEAEEVA